MTHLNRAIEVMALFGRSEDFRSSGDLLDELQDLCGTTGEESLIKRSINSVGRMVELEPLLETQPGRGRRFSLQARNTPEWMLPLLARYLTMNGVATYHPALEGLVHSLKTRTLYYVTLFREARDSGRIISFNYRGSLDLTPKIRRVHVSSLEIRGNRFLAAGRDLAKNAIRQFSLARVADPVSLEEKRLTAVIDGERIRHSYDQSLNIFMGGKEQTVEIRLQGRAAREARREFFHHSQKFQERKGVLHLSLRVNNRYEVFALLNRYLGEAELLVPVEWRREYAGLLRKSAKMNEIRADSALG